jgi:PAS domain S-box-containing protein
MRPSRYNLAQLPRCTRVITDPHNGAKGGGEATRIKNNDLIGPMLTDLRRLGISASTVSWGTHLCHFYETTQDLLATTVPYFHAGLETNEFCIWAIPEALRAETMDALGRAVPDVDRYLADRQLEIVPIRDWYLKGGTFDAARVSSAWFQKLDEALARGYAGMRVSGLGDWVDEQQWHDFSCYEASINEAIRDRRMIALCCYSLGSLGAAAMLDVVRSHQRALARRPGTWEVVGAPELQRAEAEARSRTLFEASHDVIVMMSTAGDILDVNRRGEAVSGHTQHDLRQMNVYRDLLPEEDHPVVRRILDDLLKGETREFQVRWKTKTGDIVYLDGASVPHFSLTGEFLSMCTLRDVTERVHAEQRITAINEQLRALSARVAAAREEESARIARELHDQLGSSLTSVKWELEILEEQCATAESGVSSNIRERLATTANLIHSTIETVRRISSELRPAVLDELGLAPAIEWQAQRFEAATGIRCYVDALLPEGLEPDREQATTAFRILQEALTNTRRHSWASRVDIVLKSWDGAFVLTISDNGVGIGREAGSRSPSLGLLSMRERAALVGGKVEISGVPGRGTTVAVHVPVTRPPRPES